MKRLPFTHKMLHQVMVGNKTQTRRLRAKDYRPGEWVLLSCNYWRPPIEQLQPTDWAGVQACITMATVLACNDQDTSRQSVGVPEGWKGIPSIHMPQWLCPFAARIVGARWEHRDQITEADARAEGFATRAEFLEYFNKLNGAVEWISPAVQVIELEGFSMPLAYEKGGLDALEINLQDHWPDGWRKQLPQHLWDAKVKQ